MTEQVYDDRHGANDEEFDMDGLSDDEDLYGAEEENEQENEGARGA
jgi:hypothetical protein